ncbi:hypothetical protein N5B56_11445 [Eubacterium sp. LFL-14]|uniref:O-antigen ligase like membrane protein n=1 Tax=Eubacterium album TaxID=2978477 RepID=A0ABT2M2D3_9FIRM|nr:hypothetical protein [Eubacterium sp. LFL-14]MCT7399687.1 hypothetical protein [Eubacterium sp. LFL-14]
MKIKISTIYIIIFCIAFIPTGGIFGIDLNYWIKYILGAVWCVLGIQLISNRKNKARDGGILRNYYGFLLIPFIVMLIHLPIVYFIYNQHFDGAVFNRIISYFVQRCILLAIPIVAALYFKLNSIKYTFYALCIDYSLVIMNAIIKYGIGNFVKFALSAWRDEWNEWQASNSIASALEVHDLTFAIGFFVLYYLLFSEQKNKVKDVKLWIAFLYMWLGFKRIEMLAILIAIIVMKVMLKKCAKKKINIKSAIINVGLIVVFIAFIAIVKSNEIQDLALQYAINFNGRLHSYALLKDYYSMSLLFLGRGYCYSTLVLDRLQDLSIIHSDILKSFVDYGFIGFCLWISYYVYFLPKKFINESKSSMSKKTAIIMITFSIYAMITYLTDNTNVYFCFQTAYLLIPFAVLFEGMKRE